MTIKYNMEHKQIVLTEIVSNWNNTLLFFLKRVWNINTYIIWLYCSNFEFSICTCLNIKYYKSFSKEIKSNCSYKYIVFVTLVVHVQDIPNYTISSS